MDNSKSTLHYRYNLFYIVVILFLTIIVLVTTEWGDIPDLVAYVSFGLTLSSLFLSLVAIIYTIFSNFGFTQNVATLQNASNNVSSNTARLTAATEQLLNNINCVPDMLNEFGKRVEKGHQVVIDKIAILSKSASTQVPAETKQGNNIVSELKSKCSFSGALALYACELAFSSKIAFDIKKFSKENVYLEEDYMNGFLSACDALDLLDVNITKGIMNVTSFNKDLNKMRDVCLARIKYLVKDHPDLFKDEKQLVEASIVPLEKYFKN